MTPRPPPPFQATQVVCTGVPAGTGGSYQPNVLALKPLLSERVGVMWQHPTPPVCILLCWRTDRHFSPGPTLRHLCTDGHAQLKRGTLSFLVLSHILPRTKTLCSDSGCPAPESGLALPPDLRKRRGGRRPHTKISSIPGYKFQGRARLPCELQRAGHKDKSPGHQPVSRGNLHQRESVS